MLHMRVLHMRVGTTNQRWQRLRKRCWWRDVQSIRHTHRQREKDRQRETHRQREIDTVRAAAPVGKALCGEHKPTTRTETDKTSLPI